MALRPNFQSVTGQDGNGNAVTLVNAGIYARNFAVDWNNVLCKDGTGSPVILVNAGLYGRRWLPEPFTSTGIQNPEIWGSFEFGPGYVGEAYLVEWYIENITQPVVFTLDSGTLPPGLTLSNIGNTARGQIDGTPTVAGTFNFVLRAKGPSANATKPFTIEITDIIPPEEGTGFVSGN
jgi:hypothetical protein